MTSRTIYLARLIGLFTLVVAVSMLINKTEAVTMVNSLVKDRVALALAGMLGVAAGLAIVLAHQVWSGVLAVVVTVFGWVILLRGATVLFLGSPATAELFQWFRLDEHFYRYLSGAAAIGLYLTVHGFAARARAGQPTSPAASATERRFG